MAKSKIRFEWDGERQGLLWAIRDKGKITYPELLEAINAADGFQGRIFSMQFIVDEERIKGIGWEPWDREPEGEVWHLWEVVDGEPCPLCGKLSRHTFCPDCGKYVYPEML